MRDSTTETALTDQFKILLITLIVPISTLFLVHDGILTAQQFFRTVIYASFYYAFIKVLCVVLHIFKIVDIWSIMETLGFRYMRMGIYGGLERVQTSVDIVTPFLAFFVLQSDHLGLNLNPRFKKAFIIFGLLSTFLSFSRYLILIFLLSLAFYWMTLSLSRMAKITVGIIIFIGSGFWIIGLEAIWAIIQKRLLSSENFMSDFTRVRQIDALMAEFWEVPIFGKGLGGYATAYIRDKVLLHSYEVQWVAFLMQFGIIGIMGLLFPCLLIALKFVQGEFSRVRWSFLGMFLLWLLSGFTNPFLISLTSGIMYTMFWLSGVVLYPGELPAPKGTGLRADSVQKHSIEA